jgi:hypothetical protein
VHRQFLSRQVEPPAFEVLADIAQEIGQLESRAERRGDGCGFRRSATVPSTGRICSPMTHAEP